MSKEALKIVDNVKNMLMKAEISFDFITTEFNHSNANPSSERSIERAK